jgi:hypothetical protein
MEMLTNKDWKNRKSKKKKWSDFVGVKKELKQKTAVLERVYEAIHENGKWGLTIVSVHPKKGRTDDFKKDCAETEATHRTTTAIKKKLRNGIKEETEIREITKNSGIVRAAAGSGNEMIKWKSEVKVHYIPRWRTKDRLKKSRAVTVI